MDNDKENIGDDTLNNNDLMIEKEIDDESDT
jgi:hypothetical protein